jgi:hypothetical protein
MLRASTAGPGGGLTLGLAVWNSLCEVQLCHGILNRA